MGEVSGKGVGEGLGAAARDGPADGVGGGSENKAEGCAEGLVKTQEGVCGEAGEESAGAFARGNGGGQRWWRGGER